MEGLGLSEGIVWEWALYGGGKKSGKISEFGSKTTGCS
jgi:hypothetical protein